MLRYALAVYILLLSLTGPNPCCCTLARAAEMAMSWVSPGAGRGIPCPACCQEQFANAVIDNEGDDEAQSSGWLPRSEGPSKRCQCEKGWCNAIPSQSFGVGSDQSHLSLGDLILNFAAPLLLDAGDFSAAALPPGARAGARSGREIRIVNHSWLC